jgi:Flp pilus assembly protein TadD
LSRGLPPSEQLAKLKEHYLQMLQIRDFSQALSVAEQALVLMPGHPQVLGDVALCQMRLGNYEASEQAYTQAMQLAPNEANLYDGMG